MAGWLIDIGAWAQGAGAAGVLVVSAIFLVTAVLAVPASWPMMLLGFLYGFGPGCGLAWVLSVASGVLDAHLGRTLMRARLQRRLEAASAWITRIDERLAARGVLVVILLRASPLSPFHIVSYALGLTRVRLRDVAVGTAIGAISPVALYVGAGASVTELARVFDGQGGGAGFWVGAGVTVAATVVATWVARSELRALRQVQQA